MAVLVLAGGAGALYLGQATYWAVAADFGGPYTGVISGLVNMGGQIAGAVTASRRPGSRRYGWETAFYVAAGSASSASSLVLRESEPAAACRGEVTA